MQFLEKKKKQTKKNIFLKEELTYQKKELLIEEKELLSNQYAD